MLSSKEVFSQDTREKAVATCEAMTRQDLFDRKDYVFFMKMMSSLLEAKKRKDGLMETLSVKDGDCEMSLFGSDSFNVLVLSRPEITESVVLRKDGQLAMRHTVNLRKEARDSALQISMITEDGRRIMGSAVDSSGGKHFSYLDFEIKGPSIKGSDFMEEDVLSGEQLRQLSERFFNAWQHSSKVQQKVA